MKVLLINGSPRKNGETATSLSIVENVLNREGIETDWFHIGTEPVRGCRHCNGCSKTNRCVFNDDGCNKLIEMCLNADGMIIGSPVYFAAPTVRCVPFWTGYFMRQATLATTLRASWVQA